MDECIRPASSLVFKSLNLRALTGSLDVHCRRLLSTAEHPLRTSGSGAVILTARAYKTLVPKAMIQNTT